MASHRLCRTSFILAAAVFWAGSGFLGPTAARGGQSAAAGERGRIRLELYGGFSLLNPKDMNQFVDYDTGVQEFTYDVYFDYLTNKNLILSWNKNAEGERKKIRNALPFGLRVRYSLTDFLDVSVGFQVLRKRHSESLNFLYTRNETASTQYLESLDIANYELDIRAYHPSLGVHVHKPIGRILKAEAFFIGGPLFGECSYENQWNYLWTIQGPGYSWETFTSNGVLSEEGSGTGISLELGARIGTPVDRKLDVFLETGYAYQVVRSLSGSGLEIRGEELETWEGRWGMRTETLTTPWGIRRLQYPTNYGTEGTGIEAFRLNLSGFRVRIGISLAF